MGSIVQGSSCLLGSPVYTPVELLLPLNLPSPVEKGHAQAEWCQQCLALPHGMPSPDPLRRGLSRRQPDARTQGCVRGTEALRESLEGARVAMDGKTLRRSCAHAASPGVIPMVSAGAPAHRLG